ICKITCSTNLLTRITAITRIMVSNASKGNIKRIALAISPLIFPVSFLEYNLGLILQSKLIPWVPLAGIDSGFLENAKEIGLEKYIVNLEDLCKKRIGKMKVARSQSSRCAKEALK